MKILKVGKNNQWSRECKCTGKGNGGGGCGALLLVEATDLYYTYSSHYDGSNEVYITFCCTQCQVQTDIDNIPHYIKPAKNKIAMIEKNKDKNNNEN